MSVISQTEVRWRIGTALPGTLLYWPMFHPDWRNVFLFLYDVPTLLAAWSFTGALLWRCTQGRSRPVMASLLALLLAVLCATGAEYADWPLSGHLTIATTVGIIEVGQERKISLVPVFALLPILLLILIRTFWPQIPRMDNPGNTLRALCVGLILSMGALRAAQ